MGIDEPQQSEDSLPFFICKCRHKSSGKGHDAASIFNDIKSGRVLEVVRGTTVDAACRAMDCLPPDQAALKVEAAALA